MSAVMREREWREDPPDYGEPRFRPETLSPLSLLATTTMAVCLGDDDLYRIKFIWATCELVHNPYVLVQITFPFALCRSSPLKWFTIYKC
jgi:hypothetical protein